MRQTDWVNIIPAKELTFGFFEFSSDARQFVVDNHYSSKCPPGRYYFKATHGCKTVGACCFRRPGLPKIADAYDVDLELSRLVLLDEAGKNSESRFIGYCLRWLRKNTQNKRVISFADPLYGHEGVIYKASNFKYLGMEKGHGTRRLCIDGEFMQAKTAYDRYGASGANLAEILPDSEITVHINPKKHVYVYELARN